MNTAIRDNRFSYSYRLSFFGWGYFCCTKSNRAVS